MYLKVATTIIALGLGYFAFLLLQPGPDIEIKTPYPVVDKEISLNEPVQLRYVYKVPQDYQRTKVTYQVVSVANDATYDLYTVYNLTIPKGEYDTVGKVTTVRFPALDLPKGKYYIQVVAESPINQIKTDTDIRRSETFNYNPEEK